MKKILMSSFIFLFILTATVFAKQGKTEAEQPNGNNAVVVPFPSSEKIFDAYELTVDGKTVPVYECRVSAVPLNQVWPGYQRPLDQTETAGFARWEMNGPVQIKIASKEKINTVQIQPRSKDIGFKRIGEHQIVFELTKPESLAVLINGTHRALHLLPVAKCIRPVDIKAKNLHYFGPGVHDVGILSLSSGESVYIDAGAVVYGSIQGRNVSHIRVEGPGMIDVSRLNRKKGGGAFWFENCQDVYLGGGIIQRDSNVWTTNIFNCDHVVISGTALIGHWRYNSDGIDICNSRHVLVENAFVRSFDDSLVVKGVMRHKLKEASDITFQNCVLWCDWGRAIKIGTETAAPEIKNIVFKNCDIIRTVHAALAIEHKDRAAVSNVRFENIRVEMDKTMLPAVLQRSKEEKYSRKEEKRSPNLLILKISKMNSTDTSRGTIRNIYFKDIQVFCETKPISLFAAYDREHDLKNVVIDNLRFNNEVPVNSAAEMNLIVQKHAKEIKFVSTPKN